MAKAWLICSMFYSLRTPHKIKSSQHLNTLPWTSKVHHWWSIHEVYCRSMWWYHPAMKTMSQSTCRYLKSIHTVASFTTTLSTGPSWPSKVRTYSLRFKSQMIAVLSYARSISIYWNLQCRVSFLPLILKQSHYKDEMQPNMSQHQYDHEDIQLTKSL